MPSESSSEAKFEIGHVLFIDLVGYSKLSIEEQKEWLLRLTDIVLATAQVRESINEQVVRLPTGDGMALVFRNSSEGLEKSFEDQDGVCWQLKIDQLYDSVCNEPRFQAILKKIGLK